MKQSELLKAISTLTPYQRRKLEMFVVDALLLNEKDQNIKPQVCPYCHKPSHMIKKDFLPVNKDSCVKNVTMSLLTTLIRLQAILKLTEVCF